MHRFDLEQSIRHARVIKCSGTGLTRSNRFFKILDSLFLACVIGALLVVQPTQLLKHLGVIGVALKDPAIGALCRFKLCEVSAMDSELDVKDKPLSVARTHGRSGTKCLLQSVVEAGW